MNLLLVVAAVIGLASADLSGDLQDIRDLFPTEAYLEIGRRYLDADAEVQHIVGYLQGPEWHGLVDDLAADGQWQDFKAWAAEQGVDVDSLVGEIHDLIDSWEWVPTDGTIGGARAFTDEIRAATPTDDILALINDKLATSVDFQGLYGKISSQDARDFLNRIMAWDEVQHLGETLRGYGIDVDAVLDFIREFLGWA